MNNYVTNDNAVTLMSAIGNKIKDTKITATANSEDITLTDTADARIHDLKIYGKTENGTSVGENGLTVTAAGKNLIDLSGNSSYEKNGLRFTKKDNIITVTGTASEMTTWVIKTADLSAYNGCILSGAPSGGTTNKWALNIELNQEPWTSCASDKGDGDLINIPEGTTSQVLFIRVWPSAGSNINLEFKVMIRNANDTSSVFEPYHEPHIININTALPLRGKMLTVDLGDLTWGGNSVRFQTPPLPDYFVPNDNWCTNIKVSNLLTPSMSPFYVIDRPWLPVDDKTIGISTSGKLFAIDHDYTDPAEFKAAVTGITLTYPSYCDEIDLADGVAITRLDSNGDVLSEPVITPLTNAEKAAFAELRTFEGTTNVTATDDPFMSMTYVKNSSNGKALANVDDRIKETDISGKVDKVAGKGLSTEDYTTAEKTKLASLSPITISSTLTLTVAGWDSQTKQQTVLTTIDTTKRNVIDITVSELPTWSECNVYAISESATGVTFQCDTIPEDALTFKITSMVVTSNA